MSTTQEIKDRLEIVDYVSRFVPNLKKSGRYYKAPCPFHSEKTPSFVVNQDTQTWRCFGACAEGGDVFNFAMKQNGWTFSEAIRELGRLVGVEISPRTPEQQGRDAQRERLLGLLKTASDFYHKHLMSDAIDALPVLEYATQKRGFTPETLERYQIGYAPKSWDAMLTALKDLGYSPEEILEAGMVSKNETTGRLYDRFRHRLMIPIRDERGNVTGFGARALDPDDQPKYLNSPQSSVFDKSKTLFGLDVAKNAIRDGGIAVIVEGYMDALQAHQAGYLNVVAQMGTAMTEAQLALLAPRYAQKIILALDADEAGQNAIRRSLEVARQTLSQDYMGRMSAEIRVMHIDNAKDPDEVLKETPELWQIYVNDAVPVADFVIDLEMRGLGKNPSLQEKQALAERVLPILLASENNLLNQENTQKLALRLRLEERQLMLWAEEIRRKESARQERKSAPPPSAPSVPKPAVKSSASDDPFNDLPYHDLPYEVGNNLSEEPPSFFEEMGNLSFEGDVQGQAKPSTSPPAKPLPTPTLTALHASRSAERFCLQMLMRDDDLLYHVNRKFRELLTPLEVFKDHPLSELMPEDFSHADYRVMLDTLLHAHQQDDAPPMDFVRLQMPRELQEVLDLLLVDDMLDLYISINGRLQSDVDDIVQKVNKHRVLDRERHAEALRRVIKVRELRLHRELQELRFLMQEASQSNDTATLSQFSKSVSQTMQALKAFQSGLHSSK